jgi:hypothetical protein
VVPFGQTLQGAPSGTFGQSLSTLHTDSGHVGLPDEHTPPTQSTLPHTVCVAFGETGHWTHDGLTAPQSAALMHAGGVGHPGNETTQIPFTSIAVAHALLPSGQALQIWGAAQISTPPSVGGGGGGQLGLTSTHWPFSHFAA